MTYCEIKAFTPYARGKTFSNRLTTMFNKQVLALPSQKIGRNDPCPCGSGQKYKNAMARKERRHCQMDDINGALIESGIVLHQVVQSIPLKI
ncbi:MAG: SEC-C metal-binding domain-containing protein [Chloroflexi bacterium]|nr:SEC-C metal-binding domain-containing protein [Chloroflexota bacterium]